MPLTSFSKQNGFQWEQESESGETDLPWDEWLRNRRAPQQPAAIVADVAFVLPLGALVGNV